MDNRKTERSNHQEYNATKKTVAAFILAVSAITLASDYLPASNNPDNNSRPNPPTNLQIK